MFSIAAHKLGSPQITLLVPESSLGRQVPHVLGNVNDFIRVIFPLCLRFFSFFLSLHGALRAVMIGAEAEGTPQSGPVHSERSVALQPSDPSHPQLLLQCRHQPFVEKELGSQNWGPGQNRHPLPHQHDFNLVGLSSSITEEMVDEPRCWMTKEKYTLAASELKAQRQTNINLWVMICKLKYLVGRVLTSVT